MKLSDSQRSALRDAHEDGRVYSTQRTISALMRKKYVRDPYYNFGRASWAWITDDGRKALAESDV